MGQWCYHMPVLLTFCYCGRYLFVTPSSKSTRLWLIFKNRDGDFKYFYFLLCTMLSSGHGRPWTDLAWRRCFPSWLPWGPLARLLWHRGLPWNLVSTLRATFMQAVPSPKALCLVSCSTVPILKLSTMFKQGACIFKSNWALQMTELALPASQSSFLRAAGVELQHLDPQATMLSSTQCSTAAPLPWRQFHSSLLPVNSFSQHPRFEEFLSPLLLWPQCLEAIESSLLALGLTNQVAALLGQDGWVCVGGC